MSNTENPSTSRKKTLSEFIAKKKSEKMLAEQDKVEDPYETSQLSKTMVRKPTGYVYDEGSVANRHYCLYDENYPECPERTQAVIERFRELSLFAKAVRIEHVDMSDIKDQVLRVHSKKHIEKLKEISRINDIEKIEREAAQYDAVYFCPGTYQAAMLAAAQVVRLVEAVAQGEIQNGMAIVRPPGHHAMHDEFNGYCFLNNVAIAAQNVLDKQLVKKILIVDFDVHHGQATQKTFYKRNDVLYFSIHRYENGGFWPSIPDGMSSFIGTDAGTGYNVNVALNDHGLEDQDYTTIILTVLLPIAYEYNPDIVIVSAGYDAALGCPEGEMRLTPAFYQHVISLLCGLAQGKVAVALEGGYFLPSLAEGAAMTFKALLRENCISMEPFTTFNSIAVDNINNTRYHLKPYWKCFDVFSWLPADGDDSPIHVLNEHFGGKIESPPYLTRNCYPLPDPETVEIDRDFIENLKLDYARIPTEVKVLITHSPLVLTHNTRDGDIPFETPNRIMSILEKLEILDLSKRITIMANQVSYADVKEQILKVHDSTYVEAVMTLEIEEGSDIFYNDATPLAIYESVGNVLTLCNEVMNDRASCGFALTRPPGHHASYDQYSGFCYVNNAVILANYAIQKYKLQRVLIFDFDIHHGDGTQNLTYNRKDILFISIHRHDMKKFFPNTHFGSHTFCGEGAGEGFNVNIPFNAGKMEDCDYLAMMFYIVLPIAYSYAPELVIISAGFDAGVYDPLGGGYKLSPEMFGMMVHMLKPLANGRVLCTLEGGYNPETVGLATAMCVKALLNDPLPRIPIDRPINDYALDVLRDVFTAHRKYWPILESYKLIKYKDAEGVAQGTA